MTNPNEQAAPDCIWIRAGLPVSEWTIYSGTTDKRHDDDVEYARVPAPSRSDVDLARDAAGEIIERLGTSLLVPDGYSAQMFFGKMIAAIIAEAIRSERDKTWTAAIEIAKSLDCVETQHLGLVKALEAQARKPKEN